MAAIKSKTRDGCMNKKYIVFDMIGVVFKSELMTNLLYGIMPHRISKKRLEYLYHQFEIGRIDSKSFWKGLKIKNHRKIESEFLSRTELDNNLPAITSYLKKKYRLGILSNMPKEWGRYFIRKYKLNKIFHGIILSGEARAKKPNSRIYKLAIKKFGRFCFIDDHIENLRAARRFGITTIFRETKKEGKKFRPDHTIHSLMELKKIL